MEAVAARARAAPRWRERLEERNVLAAVLIAPAITFVLVLVGGPLLLAMWLSFTTATAGSFSGDFIGLENFTREWNNPIFRDALKNTFIFVFVSQAIVLVCAKLLANFLVKDFRGKWIVRLLPFATIIIIAGLASIPKEVQDAAAVDGATGWQRLVYITLPMLLPIMTIAVLFGIVFTATDMIVVYLLTNGGPFNSTQMITTWAFQTGIISGALGDGAAVSLYLFPILLVVTILMLWFARRTEVA
jgi:ABC-type sugar transport system permease subunit